MPGIKTIHVIRHRGDPKTAETLDGYKVERKEKIFVRMENWNVFIPTAPYDDHFIYETPYDPKKGIGVDKPSFMCTCGSAAVITPGIPGGFGNMLVCMHHATYGLHVTGGTQWR